MAGGPGRGGVDASGLGTYTRNLTTDGRENSLTFEDGFFWHHAGFLIRNEGTDPVTIKAWSAGALAYDEGVTLTIAAGATAPSWFLAIAEEGLNGSALLTVAIANRREAYNKSRGKPAWLVTP